MDTDFLSPSSDLISASLDLHVDPFDFDIEVKFNSFIGLKRRRI